MTGLRLDAVSPHHPALLAALAAASLPTDDVDDGPAVFFAAGLSAFGGLVRWGDIALLRSLVVEPEERGKGVGAAMVGALIAEAAQAGVRELWLLTESARAFFDAQGFEAVDRDAAPPCIRATRQFSALCPASATLMRRMMA